MNWIFHGMFKVGSIEFFKSKKTVPGPEIPQSQMAIPDWRRIKSQRHYTNVSLKEKVKL